MISREELLKSSDYWTEIIQNKIFNDLSEFIGNQGISNNQIAESLGLSKGRVSQILSGENLNFRLDTLVKLCLTINRIPDFHLIAVNEFIAKDKDAVDSIIFKTAKSYVELKNDNQIYSPERNQTTFRLSATEAFFSKETSINDDKLFINHKAA